MTRRKSEERGEGLDKFANETTIHGLRDCFQHKDNLCILFIWITVITGAIVFLAFGLYSFSLECTEERTVSSDARISLTKFPEMLYCPTDWISSEKLEKLAVDRNMVQHFLSIFYSSEIMVDLLLNGATYNKTAFENLQDLIGREFDNNVANFGKAIAFDPEEILAESPNILRSLYNEPPAIELKTFLTNNGACYMIKPTKEYHSFMIRFGSINVTLFHQKLSYGRKKNQNRISIGHPQHFQDMQIPLEPEVNYFIRPSVEIHTDANLNKRPCGIGEEHRVHDAQRCSTLCVNEECARRGDCQIFFPTEESRAKLADFCTCLDKNKTCDAMTMPETVTDGQYQECMNHCVSPCTREVYSATVLPMGKAEMEHNSNDSGRAQEGKPLRSYLYFTLDNPTYVNERTELKTCTLENMAAKVGGILGILCGASILSVVHLITFLLSECCCQKKMGNMQ